MTIYAEISVFDQSISLPSIKVDHRKVYKVTWQSCTNSASHISYMAKLKAHMGSDNL